MNVSLDVCSKSLNKREEELCGDTVEIVKTADADIIILSDGREGIVSAYNEASNLRPKIRLMNGREIDLMNIDEYSALTILKPNNDDMALAEDIEEIEHKRKRRRETYQKNKKDAF